MGFFVVLAIIYLGLNRSLGEGAAPVQREAWAVNPNGHGRQSAGSRSSTRHGTDYVIPGLLNTLTAALWAAVSLVFGLVRDARLSDHAWIRILGVVVEFFRASRCSC